MCHSISIYLDNMYVSSFHNRTWAVGREQPNGDLSGGNNVLVTHDPSSDKDMGIKPWYDILRVFLFFFWGGYFKLRQRNGQINKQVNAQASHHHHDRSPPVRWGLHQQMRLVEPRCDRFHAPSTLELNFLPESLAVAPQWWFVFSGFMESLISELSELG
jgi:hypothetical protein